MEKTGEAVKEEEEPPGGPEFNLPGLARLRETVANYLKIPASRLARRDGLASLTTALSSVPDGMASGLLAGVNPIHGLYACMVAPIVGGIFSSTQLMVVTTTSAAALMAGQAIAGAPADDRLALLFTMVVLIGIFQVLFGLLGFGRLTRFVSYSVMTGFVIGIAVLTILSQMSTVTGYDMTGANRVAEALDLVANLDKVHLTSLGSCCRPRAMQRGRIIPTGRQASECCRLSDPDPKQAQARGCALRLIGRTRA